MSQAVQKFLPATHLIILPCHAIYKGCGSGTEFSHWYMEEFQKEGNDHLSWIKQIETCIKLLNNDIDNSIVVISGGKTKKVGNISESFSYLNLVLQNKADFLSKYQNQDELIDKIYLEEYARDSFENVFFSRERFQQITNRIPDNVTVVGYNFKRTRFVDYHLKTIGFEGEVDYIGIDPTPPYPLDSEDYRSFFEDLHHNEYEKALKLFKSDPTGQTGILLEKKMKRNPYNTFAPYVKEKKVLIFPPQFKK